MTRTAYQCEIDKYRSDGYFITPVMYDESQLAELRDEAQRLWEQAIEQADQGKVEKTRRLAFVGWLHERSPVFARFLKSEPLLDVARQMIGDDVDIAGNQLVLKAPNPEGRNTFAWHQDSFYAAEQEWDKQIILDDSRTFQCWVALNDATVENGCLRVIPGDHRGGLLEHGRDPVNGEFALDVDESRAVLAEMKAGQMLIFSIGRLRPHRWGLGSVTRWRRRANVASAARVSHRNWQRRPAHGGTDVHRRARHAAHRASLRSIARGESNLNPSPSAYSVRAYRS